MKERPVSTKWLIEPRFSDDGTQISSGIRYDGKEVADPVPMAPPVGYSAPTQLEALIEQIVHRRDFERSLAAQGAETFDEADDFDVEDDDYDPRFEETLYEKYFEAKSKRAAARAAQSVATDQRVSSGLDAAPSRVSSAETPKSVSGGDTNSSVDSSSKSGAPVMSQSQSGHSESK